MGVLGIDERGGAAGRAGRSPGSTAAGIGYMPEERGLYPKQPILDQLVYLAQLHGHGPRSRPARQVTELPGAVRPRGPRQGPRREAVAGQPAAGADHRRAHGHARRALVLDEPFSGLDPRAVDSMADLLREHTARGVPVLFSATSSTSSSDCATAWSCCPRAAVVAAGTVAELRDAGVPRFRLVLGGDAGWVRDLHGLEVLDLEGASALVEVRRGRRRAAPRRRGHQARRRPRVPSGSARPSARSTGR